MDDLFQAAMLRASGVTVPKVRIPIESTVSSSASPNALHLSTSSTSTTSSRIPSKDKPIKSSDGVSSSTNTSKDVKGVGNKRPRSESPLDASKPVNKEDKKVNVSSGSSSSNSAHSSSVPTSLRSPLAPTFCPASAGATEITNDCGFRLGKHISLPSLCSGYTHQSSSSSSSLSTSETLCVNCSQGPAAHLLIDLWYPSLPDTRNAKKNQYLMLSSTIAWRRRIYVLIRNMRALIFTPKQTKENILPYTLTTLLSIPIEETIRLRSTKLFEMIKEILEILQHLRTMTSYSTVSGTIADGNIVTSGWIDKLQHRIDQLNTHMVTLSDSKEENNQDNSIDSMIISTRARDALRCVTALESVYMELFVADVGGGVGMGKLGTTLSSAATTKNANFSGSNGATYLYASIPPPHLHLQTLVNKFTDIIVNDANKEWLNTGDKTDNITNIVYNKNMLLQYLQLRETEAQSHLQISRLFNAALLVEGAVPGPYESTLRGTDPLTAPSIREWWNVCRDRVAAWTAFACPTIETLREIYNFASASSPSGTTVSMNNASDTAHPRHPTIIEIGAGTGYWAALLQSYSQGKINMKAYDTHPPFNIIRRYHGSIASGGHSLELVTNTAAGKIPNKNLYIPSNDYHGPLPAWTTVTKGDTNILTSNNVGKHTVLFLCYPPPNDDRMALASLSQFGAAGGQRLALVGEFRGDTGSVNFEKALANEWKLIKTVNLPNFDNTIASLTLWERYIPEEETTATYVFKWPLYCAVCGKYPRAPWERKARSKVSNNAEEDTNEDGHENEDEELTNEGVLTSTGPTFVVPSKRVKNGFARDRLTRNIVVCSNTCGNDPQAMVALNQELQKRHLPLLSPPTVTNDDKGKSKLPKKNFVVSPPETEPIHLQNFAWDKNALWRYGRLI